MEDFTIAIYCFLDDYLKKSYPKEDKKRKLNHAEVLSTAILSARYYGGNMVKARGYMRSVCGCNFPHKSNFNRHLHRLSEVLSSIFFALGQSLKQMNTAMEYLIDSFPIAVCKNIRLKRSKLLPYHKAYHGYNSSKKEFFYGFKVQVITTANGIPVEYFISAGSYHDFTAFEAMNIDLPENSKLYADSAYTCYDIEDLYLECHGIEFLVERKSNSNRPDTPAMAFVKKAMRKRIETTFSDLQKDFPKHIHAVTPRGFLLKILLFLIAHTLQKSV